MGLEEILAALAKIEGVSQDHIAGIRKAYEGATGEANAWKSRADRAEATANRLNELIGGSDKDAKTALENLQKQVTDLTTERDRYKGEAETLKANIKEAEKLEAIANVAAKASVDKDGLIAMLKSGVLPRDKVAVTGEGEAAKITVDGKDLTEYIKGMPAYLQRALVIAPTEGDNQQNNQNTQTPPTAPQNTNTSGNAPTGGTNGGTANKNPVLGAIEDLGFAIPGVSNK